MPVGTVVIAWTNVSNTEPPFATSAEGYLGVPAALNSASAFGWHFCRGNRRNTSYAIALVPLLFWAIGFTLPRGDMIIAKLFVTQATMASASPATTHRATIARIAFFAGFLVTTT